MQRKPVPLKKLRLELAHSLMHKGKRGKTKSGGSRLTAEKKLYILFYRGQILPPRKISLLTGPSTRQKEDASIALLGLLQCNKCNLRLCCTKNKNCFFEFHT